jgi:hypothetical protein
MREFEVTILKRTLAMRAPFWYVIDILDSSFLIPYCFMRVISARKNYQCISTTADRHLVHSIVSSQILYKREKENRDHGRAVQHPLFVGPN